MRRLPRRRGAAHARVVAPGEEPRLLGQLPGRVQRHRLPPAAAAAAGALPRRGGLHAQVRARRLGRGWSRDDTALPQHGRKRGASPHLSRSMSIASPHSTKPAARPFGRHRGREPGKSGARACTANVYAAAPPLAAARSRWHAALAPKALGRNNGPLQRRARRPALQPRLC